MEKTNAAIEKICNSVWAKYDVDNNGQLDYGETKKFTLEVTSQIVKDDPSFKNPTEEELEKVFKELDKDGSGLVDKSEMFEYLKKELAK